MSYSDRPRLRPAVHLSMPSKMANFGLGDLSICVDPGSEQIDRDNIEMSGLIGHDLGLRHKKRQEAKETSRKSRKISRFNVTCRSEGKCLESNDDTANLRPYFSTRIHEEISKSVLVGDRVESRYRLSWHLFIQ